MTREEYDSKVVEIEEKHKRKERLTREERKILKTEIGQIFSFGVAMLGCILFVPAICFPGAAIIHHEVTIGKMLKENEADFEAFKAEQIQKLNEEFDNGKGFSTKEYSEKLEQMESHAVHDFFTTAVSEEMKMEYQKQNSIDDGLFNSAVAFLASGGLFGLGGLSAGFAYSSKEQKLINEDEKDVCQILTDDVNELKRKVKSIYPEFDKCKDDADENEDERTK